MGNVSGLRRGDLVRVRLDPAEGAEQSGERPALVISPDLINEHSPVVLVAPITSKRTTNIYPFETLIEPPEGGLSKPSKVMLIQMRAVAKSRIARRYGRVTASTMEKVEAAIRVATGLVRV